MHAVICVCRIRHSHSTKRGFASISKSNFSARCFNRFFELVIIPMNKIDASQLSRIVELRFLKDILFTSFTSLATSFPVQERSEL